MFKKFVVLTVLFTLILGFIGTSAFAQNPVRKLGRGMANILTGFFEIPVNIVDAAEEEGFVAAITYGVVKGVAMGALRSGVGIYEAVTFLVPFPWNYEPILEPEFMMSDERF